MKSAAKYFVGTRDFAAFAANRGKPERTTIRTINSARVRKKGPCITIEFDGDGFLYKMVRLMVGALVQCALGKMRIDEITSRLRSGKIGPARFTAAAEGLYLVRCATRESAATSALTYLGNGCLRVTGWLFFPTVAVPVWRESRRHFRREIDILGRVVPADVHQRFFVMLFRDEHVERRDDE